MTDSNAITASGPNQMEAPRPQAIVYTLQAKVLIDQLRFMIVNGNKLQDPEIKALAQYAEATQLNPFAGECYYIPGKGPCPGIAGWRKKAQEQMQYEASLLKQPAYANFWVEFREATPADCKFDLARGDVAIVAILHDRITQKAWREDLYGLADHIFEKAAGQIKYIDAVAMARSDVKQEPVVEGAGVVFGGENFGSNDKFDRIERAKKRAEKLALRKRFPRLHIPEPEGADTIDAETYTISVEKPDALPLTDADVRKVNRDMGFSDPEPKPVEGELENISSEPKSPWIMNGEGPAVEQPTEPPAAEEGKRPFSPEVLKIRIQNGARKYASSASLKPSERSLVMAGMTNLFVGIEGAREFGLKVFEFLTGETESSKVGDGWFYALNIWLNIKTIDGEPMPSGFSSEEGMAIIEFLQK